MLFKGEEGMKPTDALSGGEAVRLIFAKLMLTKDNVLVLDEPTNHLDLESIVALGDALRSTRARPSSSPTTATSSELRQPPLRVHRRRAWSTAAAATTSTPSAPTTTARAASATP